MRKLDIDDIRRRELQHAEQATKRHFETMVKELEEAGYRVEIVDLERYNNTLKERAIQLCQTGLLK